MALEFHTGFDMLAVGAGVDHFSQMGWTEWNIAPTVQTSPVRNGARSISFSASNYLGMANLSNAVTRVLGFGYYGTGAGGQRVLAVMGDGSSITVAGNIHIGVALDSTGHLELRRGAPTGAVAPGTLLQTSTNTLSLNTWYFIELVVTVDNTTGHAEVYVNGSKTGWIDFTGDTQNTANAYSNLIGIAPGVSAFLGYFDDVYTLTGTGAAPTARIGDCKSVVKLAGTDAVLGAGTYADSTPSTGTDRGAMVDEAQPDDDTTYNGFTAAAQKDAYKTVALGLTGSVKGATVRVRLKKSDAGDGSAQFGLRSGSVDDFSADVFPSDASYAWFNRIYATDPNTGAAWTIPNLDAAQLLVKRTL